MQPLFLYRSGPLLMSPGNRGYQVPETFEFNRF